MSLLEAMAYGRCCVTSDIPECADVLEGHGMTFEKGNADALRAVLQNLLEAPEHVQQLGTEAKRHVEESYSWDSVVAKTLAIYRGEK
jgi:glycosyltransferase involved in cell wall biosynthesis